MRLLLALLVALVACAPARSSGAAPPAELVLETPAPVVAPLGAPVPVRVHGPPSAELALWFPGARAGMTWAATDARGEAVFSVAPIALGSQLVGVMVWSGPPAPPIYFELDGR